MRLLAAALLLVLGGCGSNGSNANSAAPACNFNKSSNRCLRCWAEKCSGQLDRCFGDGFHAGELIPGNDTPAYPTASCRDYSVCIQACECLDSCFDSCKKNIAQVCSDCQEMIFSPCRAEKCSAECSPPDGGA
jgi:hypothetical protein